LPDHNGCPSQAAPKRREGMSTSLQKRGNLFLGGPTRHYRSQSLDRELDAEERTRALEILRDHYQAVGQVGTFGPSFAWTHQTGARSLTVSISSGQGQTQIRFEERFDQVAGGLFGGIGGGLGGGGGGLVAAFFGVAGGPVAALSALVGAMGLSLLLARTLYRRTVSARMAENEAALDTLLTSFGAPPSSREVGAGIGGALSPAAFRGPDVEG
jgi:hypothetical protein